MAFDITAIVTAHAEGILLGQTMQSLEEAVDFAVQEKGVSIEVLVAMDNPTPETEKFIEGYIKNTEKTVKLSRFSFKDQGLVRNAMCKLSDGKYIAFLDGDDLWSYNWLSEAYRIAEQNPNFIVHPEFNWFFGGSNGLLKHVDQRSPEFNPEVLRVANYWDALCFCRRDIHLEVPYSLRDVKSGFAYEDWHWNCETFVEGYQHVVADSTIHFKRRRENSQTIESSKNNVLMRETALTSYAFKLD